MEHFIVLCSNKSFPLLIATAQKLFKSFSFIHFYSLLLLYVLPHMNLEINDANY